MPKGEPSHILRVTARSALISAALAALFFFTAGTNRLRQATSQGRVSITDDLLFPGGNGNPLRARKLLDSYFVPLLQHVGLRRFRFHDLRHTFGNLLIEAGAPLPYVRGQMGHSSIQIAADKYVHLIPHRNVHFIDRLDANSPSQPSAT